MCKLLETNSHILWGENIFMDYFDGAACRQSIFAHCVLHTGVRIHDPLTADFPREWCAWKLNITVYRYASSSQLQP